MAESSSVPPVGPPSSGWTEMDVSVDLIDPSPFQVRTVIDPKRLEQLADSMRVSGLRNRILLRPLNGRYQLIGGERRWRAAMLLGWKTIPARVREMSDEEARREFVGDNEQRDDTTLIEKAKSYKLLSDPPDNKTHDEIALWVGRPRSMITETMGLLTQPKEIQTWIDSGSLTMSHLQFLKRIPDEAQRLQLSERAVKENWSTRETSRHVANFLQRPKPHRKTETEVTEVSSRGGSDSSAKVAQKKSSASETPAEALSNLASQALSRVLGRFTDKILHHIETHPGSATSKQRIHPSRWALLLLALGAVALFIGDHVPALSIKAVSYTISGTCVVWGFRTVFRYGLAVPDRWLPAYTNFTRRIRSPLHWPRLLQQRARGWIDRRRRRTTAPRPPQKQVPEPSANSAVRADANKTAHLEPLVEEQLLEELDHPAPEATAKAGTKTP